MKVLFKRTWLNPQDSRVRKGLQEVPDKWRDKLPSDAKIVDDNYEAPEPEAGPDTLREVDAARAVTDAEGKIRDEANVLIAEKAATAKANRQAALARARAAKVAKKEAAKAASVQEKK